MKGSTKAFLVGNLVVLVVLAVLATGAVAKIDWHQVLGKLSSASMPEIVLMEITCILALFIRPFRLLVLIHAIAPEASRRYWPVWRADLISTTVNSLIPVRAGDVAMAFLLRQGLGIRAAHGFSTVLVDRVFDFLTAAVMLIVALSLAPRIAPWTSNLATNVPIGIAVLALGLWSVVRLRHVWLAILDRLLARLSPPRRQSWGERAHDLLEGMGVVDRPAVVIPALAISIALWAAISTSFWFGVSAVWPAVPAAASVFAASAVALSFVVPTPPGRVGVFHTVAALALSLFDVPPEAALAAAIICHACQMGTVLMLGTLALIYQGVSIRSLSTLRETDL